MSFLSDAALHHLRAVADEPDLAGTRYRDPQRIGRGGMGTVFAAEDVELNRAVALKVLSAADPEGALAARLLAEAKILARLEHPGIVPVHDVGRLPDGRVFYVMKLVRGHRLDEIAPRLTDIAAALRIVLRICEAVGFAHAHGVIHRDLKPENIMVGEFGEVLVLDWGVAKVREAAVSANPTMLAGESEARGAGDTAFGTRIGTPAYMAPEQASGDVGRMDERTDVFGIGAILAVLLLRGPWLNGGGKPPAAESLPRALDQARPALPRPLRSIARRALASSPAERYDSVTSLADDLTRFLDARSVSAHPEGPLERAGRIVSRYRFVVALVVTYMVLRILLILFTS